MHLLYNGQLLPEEELRLPYLNRAFQYNDGFFETIMVLDGQLRFWQDHQQRMNAAAQALHLHLPQSLQQPLPDEKLLQLVQQNKAAAYGRLKLKVWRGGAGLYTPETNKADWLATAQPATKPSPAPLRVGICEGIHTRLSPFSFFKGPNSLLYVMAGIHKQAEGFDDMILLSAAGHVAEFISASLFWIKGSTIFTPALCTGCVNGILRRNLLRWCRAEGIAVTEVEATPQELYLADAVFAANVTGIRRIAKIKHITFNQEHPLIDWLLLRVAGNPASG